MLVGFIDLDWDGEVDGWKTTTGYFSTLSSGPIILDSIKKQSIPISVVGVECRATVNASEEVLCIR